MEDEYEIESLVRACEKFENIDPLSLKSEGNVQENANSKKSDKELAPDFVSGVTQLKFDLDALKYFLDKEEAPWRSVR